MARRTPALLLVLVLFGGLLAGRASADRAKPPKEDYYELYKLLVDTMDQVERNYVKQIDRRELVEAAIEGVIGKLDPYSSYIGPDQLGQFRSTVESEFGGIGIQISTEGRQLTILSPLVGTPAYRAGLLAGDRIVEIDGQSTEGIGLEEAVRRLKGEEGTQVKLTVIHPGKTDRVEVAVTRERIHVDTVLGDRRKEDDTWEFMLRPGQDIGYVRIAAFSRDTGSELRKVLEELRARKMRGLVLDMRFNPGGLLSAAIEVSDLFISKGLIVSTKGRNSPRRTWEAGKDGTFEGFPMAVLVNRFSASASEIVSACLQDHKRAVVVGERTWGKGSVQNVIELEKGRSALKLTTATYRRPSGKNIDRIDTNGKGEWGVLPDEGFELRLKDAEMEALVRDRRQRDIVRPHPEERQAEQTDSEPAEAAETPPDGQADQPPEEPPFVDRQLQMALDYLNRELARAE